MRETALRVYADTSVYGGVYDEEFDVPSRTFFEQVRAGRFELILSAVVAEELEQAPERVREVFEDVLPLADIAEVTGGCTASPAGISRCGHRYSEVGRRRAARRTRHDVRLPRNRELEFQAHRAL